VTPGDLAGQAGIITGAGDGIGATTARELAGLGARLVLGDLAAEPIERLATALGEARAVHADVRSFEDTTRLAAVCLEAYGRIDFVVANAGVDETTSMTDGDPERWRAVVETNVLGTAYTIRSVLPHMRARGGGHVVLMASVSGRETYVGQPLYVASKWAVIGLGRSLRKEVRGDGIRVTLIEPGLVDTRLSRGSPLGQHLLESIQPLVPADVARAVAYALLQPAHVNVGELLVQPVEQE
jgi:NADP-dependent 3-hydroxy acid dehydrogenase YdfG